MTDEEKLIVRMQTDSMDRMADTITAFTGEVRAEFIKQDVRLDKMQKQLDMYATAIKIAKFAATVLVLVVTMQLGDVRELWKQFFN